MTPFPAMTDECGRNVSSTPQSSLGVGWSTLSRPMSPELSGRPVDGHKGNVRGWQCHLMWINPIM
jgi:hypothetical protein